MDTDRSEATAIRVSNLVKAFGTKVVVDDVSFAVPRGSVYGLIGPNGAGKTTTFSMLAGFLRPTSGIVEVLGHRPTQTDALRSRLGVLPQDAILPASESVGGFLLHLGALQALPADRIEPGARAVLAEVGGADWWRRSCSLLSHGMAKRVQLAQALLGDPEVVLLDEPTAGLDPKVAFEVRDVIRRRKGRATMIVSSHNLHELEQICDGACVLDRGRVVASGSMAELTSSSSEVRITLAPGPLPLDVLRTLPLVQMFEFDEAKREISIFFDRSKADAETVIGQVLWTLLQHQARISAVSKGRGLEQRVMELT